MRRLYSLFVLMLCGIIGPVGAADLKEDTSVCRRIELDSFGMLSINSSKVKGVATSHGLNGIADYIEITPPHSDALRGYEIRKLVLMADVRPMPNPKCGLVGKDPFDELISCGQSVPDTRLKLIARMGRIDVAIAESRMRNLVEYVKRDVLCHVESSAR